MALKSDKQHRDNLTFSCPTTLQQCAKRPQRLICDEHRTLGTFCIQPNAYINRTNNLNLHLPGSERFVQPWPFPWPAVYICTGGSGTRFSPATQKKFISCYSSKLLKEVSQYVTGVGSLHRNYVRYGSFSDVGL
jgi:hypothetical protein